MSNDRGPQFKGSAGNKTEDDASRPEVNARDSKGPRPGGRPAPKATNCKQVRWYVEQVHEAAKGVDGVIVPMAICPSTDRKGDLWTEHEHVAVGDVDKMVTLIEQWVARGANVYVAWAVYRVDTPRESRGAAKYVAKVLALVADRDTDDAKSGVSVIDPTIEVISSQLPNANEVYVFDTPLDLKEAHPLGRALRRAMRADSGTGDIVRLTRIPGTANFPNFKKISERRRPIEPQPVILGDGGTNSRVAVQRLVEAIQQKTGRPISDFAEAARTADGSGPRAGLEALGIDEHEAQHEFEQLPRFIQRKIEQNDRADRSKHMFNVTMLLMEQDLSDHQIAAILFLHPGGVAAKIHFARRPHAGDRTLPSPVAGQGRTPHKHATRGTAG
jgi:hypothetical protein